MLTRPVIFTECPRCGGPLWVEQDGLDGSLWYACDACPGWLGRAGIMEVLAVKVRGLGEAVLHVVASVVRCLTGNSKER
ncbi:MAG TPA: hypothetical protein VIK99_01625 [Thermaerobacter sp.]